MSYDGPGQFDALGREAEVHLIHRVKKFTSQAILILWIFSRIKFLNKCRSSIIVTSQNLNIPLVIHFSVFKLLHQQNKIGVLE